MEIGSSTQSLGAEQLKIAQQQSQQAVELASQAASQVDSSPAEINAPATDETLGQNLAVYA